MRTQHRIRRVGLEDLERVLEIEKASFGPEAYDRKLFAEYFHRCGHLFLLAEQGRYVSGYILTCLRASPRGLGAELISVAVDPAFRRAGTATALLESTLRRLRKRGVTHLRLVVRWNNYSARALYEKYGFRRVRRLPRYYEDGEDGIAMKLAMHSRLRDV
ncbi:MAG: ribosomal-protein-alanine N-acetyltransferase [Terriglobia bacterium]|nr:MAG: ribosomal-protein-alanine N-acetyltransferase [Terriglobia bacterium]